jgi:hypothetical protein
MFRLDSIIIRMNAFLVRNADNQITIDAEDIRVLFFSVFPSSRCRNGIIIHPTDHRRRKKSEICEDVVKSSE